MLFFALSGCGGAGSGTGASTATGGGSQTGTESVGKTTARGGGEAKKETGGRSPGPGAKVRTAPLKVSGGGSSQYRVKGGDNSIQNFGEESDEAELEEAAATLHDYLVARAEGDWPTACANLAKSVREQLRTLASRSENLGEKGCAAILAALTPPLPPSVRRESTTVDAGSLRTEGERAFLIYRGAKGTVYTVTMVPEGGRWKVSSLAVTPLS
jgi:hypothetical protein